MQLSVQLYTLRTIEDDDAMLDAVQAAGYRNVELYGAKLAAADGLAPKLKARGLAASGSHVALKDLREDLPKVVSDAQQLGISSLFVPPFPSSSAIWMLPGGGLWAWILPGTMTRWHRTASRLVIITTTGICGGKTATSRRSIWSSKAPAALRCSGRRISPGSCAAASIRWYGSTGIDRASLQRM